jgi:hypothetical protein
MLGLEIRPFLEMGWYFDMKITDMHGELDSICESENIQQSNEIKSLGLLLHVDWLQTHAPTKSCPLDPCSFT